MSDHQYKFNVTMTCGGCSGAVERVLKKLDGKSHCSALHNIEDRIHHSFPVHSATFRTLFPLYSLTDARGFFANCTGVKEYNVSLETQTADITAEDSLSYETVLEKIKKTGKTVNSGEADGVPQPI